MPLFSAFFFLVLSLWWWGKCWIFRLDLFVTLVMEAGWFFRRDTILEGCRYSIEDVTTVFLHHYTPRPHITQYKLSCISLQYQKFGWNVQDIICVFPSKVWLKEHQIQVSEMGFIFLRAEQNRTTVLEQLDTSEVFAFSLSIHPLHTSYLSFFLHRQNFWILKFTPKNANFSR